jgi:hypothetical protein
MILSPAAGAYAEEINLMPFGDKSRRGRASFIESAAGYFEKPIAGPALKMMVVFLARYFIERSKFGCVDLLQPALFDKELQITIYGCLIQRTHRTAPGLENIVDTQWPVRKKKDLLDGLSLTRFPLHLGSTALDFSNELRQQS